MDTQADLGLCWSYMLWGQYFYMKGHLLIIIRITLSFGTKHTRKGILFQMQIAKTQIRYVHPQGICIFLVYLICLNVNAFFLWANSKGPQISLHKCAGWSGPLLFAYLLTLFFAWHRFLFMIIAQFSSCIWQFADEEYVIFLLFFPKNKNTAFGIASPDLNEISSCFNPCPAE